MEIRNFVETLYKKKIAEFVGCEDFKKIESGSATRVEYDRFIANFYRTHHNSPQFLAFLYSMVPPSARERVKHNLMEEMGLEDEGGVSHPQMFENVVIGAGMKEDLPTLQHLASETHKSLVMEPLMYGSLREVGFGSLCEVTSFEYLLSKVSDQIAEALEKHRGMNPKDLQWFAHHGEVDIQHAEEGLKTIQEYAEYYDIEKTEGEDIAKMVLRENVFIKRYFGEIALARFRKAL